VDESFIKIKDDGLGMKKVRGFLEGDPSAADGVSIEGFGIAGVLCTLEE
jgi:hypothetical protein